jgi:L-ribulose-5-phosphate 3-epimerase UlaE
VHVKDAMPKVIRGIPFEKGIVPFRETFQALVQTGFWGLIGIEIWGAMHTDEDPIDSVAAARRFVGNLVSEAWPDSCPFSIRQEEKQPASKTVE